MTKSGSAASPMHPLIRIFVDTPWKFVQATAQSGDPVLRTISLLTQGVADETSCREALRMARHVSLKECDPCVAMVFFAKWAQAAVLADCLYEAGTVLKRAGELERSAMPAEIRAAINFSSAQLVLVKGNNAEYGRILGGIVRMLSQTSSSRAIFVLNRALHLAQLGMAADAKVDIDWLAGAGDFYTGIDLVHYIDHLECAKPAEAAQLLPLRRPPTILMSYDGTYEFLLTLLWDKVGPCRPGSASPGPGFPAGLQPAKEAPLWVAATEALYTRRPGEALRAARQYAALKPREVVCGMNFPAVSLIRAELSCGHGEAARRLIAMRREVGNSHYLDDLFLARAEMLAGNREAAAAHFAAAEGACRHYGAEPRLEFELRLACELSCRDLSFLVSSAEKAAGRPKASFRSAAGSALPESAVGPARLVGSSAAMTRIRGLISQIAPSGLPVLITGETGSGKELLARAIHEASPRRESPFLAINCGAIAESLLESELFGHEKGAFTGAERSHRGIFEEAGGGTLLLDEIGDISQQLQVALLRVLDSGEIRPVGSARTRKVSCRVLAATNADLESAVQAGRFRADLFYRLKQLSIHLPPLRERREDIVNLARHFLNEGRRCGETALVQPDLEAALRARDWPGNVRELRSEIERMRLMNSDGLSYSLADAAFAETAPPVPPPQSEASSTPTAGGAEDVAAFLHHGRTQLRRLDRLRALFREHGRLTRSEVAHILKVTTRTATKDLKMLRQDGHVERIEPTASPRTHYFQLRAGGPQDQVG